MKRRQIWLALPVALLGCGVAVAPVAQYEAMSTETLWVARDRAASAQDVAQIEAELGSRGVTASGDRYLGERSSVSVGQHIYGRSTPPSGDKNCADFLHPAAAQKFFLAEGGPLSDPHGLDRDGDGMACDWGQSLRRSAARGQAAAKARAAQLAAAHRCYTGERGGTYTITASGARDYDGC